MMMIESDGSLKNRAYVCELMKIALRALEREFAANNWQVTHTHFVKSNALGIQIVFLSLHAMPTEVDHRVT